MLIIIKKYIKLVIWSVNPKVIGGVNKNIITIANGTIENIM